MKPFSIVEAQANFSEVVELVLQGEEVIVTSMGKPTIKISPYQPTKQNKRLGLMKGQAKIPDDFSQWPQEEAKILTILE